MNGHVIAGIDERALIDAFINAIKGHNVSAYTYLHVKRLDEQPLSLEQCIQALMRDFNYMTQHNSHATLNLPIKLQPNQPNQPNQQYQPYQSNQKNQRLLG